jgi:hypothetical protein
MREELHDRLADEPGSYRTHPSPRGAAQPRRLRASLT